MSNIVKCEWCGHNYNIIKNDSCPKCGGTNNINPEDINEVYKQNQSKSNEQKISENKKVISKVVKWILFMFFGLPVVLFLIIFFSILIFGNVKTTSSTLDSKDTTIENKLDLSVDLSAFENLGSNKFRYNAYNTDDFKIEIGDTNLYIPYLYIDDGVGLRLYPTISFFVENRDISNHDIDVFLVAKDKKYRIIADAGSFSGDRIQNLNQLLSTTGEISAYASIELESESKITAKDFDSIIVEVDGVEYSSNLKNTKVYNKSKSEVKKYSITDKVKLGNTDSLAINSITIDNYGYGDSYVSMDLSTNISEYSKSEIEFYLENADGTKYKLYEDNYFSYNASVNRANDILSNNISSDNFDFTLYSTNLDYEKLIVIVDGEETVINL